MHKPGYKHTSLGWIPEDWKVVRLDSVIDLINGKAFKPTEWEKSGLPIIRIQNLNDQNADFNYCNKPVEDKYYVNYGDLLFAWSGTKGVSFGVRKWEMGLAVLNQHIFKISLKGEALIFEYALPVLKFVQNNIEDKAHGFKSSFVHVKKYDLDKTSLPLPPPSEQHHIAAILSTWDTAIAKEQCLIDTLETRHCTLMQQLLSGKKRVKGFKDEWKITSLEQILSRMTNGITYNPENTHGLPVTRIETISSGTINLDKVGYTDTFQHQEEYRLQYGDILYSHINSLPHIGKVAIYLDEKPLYHGMNLLLLRINQNANREFIYYWFKSEKAKKVAQSIAQPAVNQVSISTNGLKKILLNLPSLSEQTAIASILNTSEKQIQTHRRKLAALQQQKKGLMQVLLTGKVRVKMTDA